VHKKLIVQLDTCSLIKSLRWYVPSSVTQRVSRITELDTRQPMSSMHRRAAITTWTGVRQADLLWSRFVFPARRIDSWYALRQFCLSVCLSIRPSYSWAVNHQTFFTSGIVYSHQTPWRNSDGITIAASVHGVWKIRVVCQYLAVAYIQETT